MTLAFAVVGLAVVPRSHAESLRQVTPRGAVPYGNIVDAGDVLVGAESSGHPVGGGVVRSFDGGRTWERAPLPEQSGALKSLDVRKLGDLVVVAAAHHPARTHDGTGVGLASYDRFVWTTVDGHTWNGPLVQAAASNHFVPHVNLLGDRLVTGARFKEGFVLFTSDDRGRSWRRAVVRGLELVEGVDPDLRATWVADDGSLRAVLHFSGLLVETYRDRVALVSSNDAGASWRLLELCDQAAPACRPTTRAGSLLLRAREASLDGGRTWAPVVFDASTHPGQFLGVEALPGGGWLATVHGWGGDDEPRAWVVRSDDGVHWAPLRSWAMTASGPVRVGRRWLVALSDRDNGFAVYEAALDARSLHRIHRAPFALGYRVTPFRWQGGAAVPVPRPDGYLRRLLFVPE